MIISRCHQSSAAAAKEKVGEVIVGVCLPTKYQIEFCLDIVDRIKRALGL